MFFVLVAAAFVAAVIVFVVAGFVVDFVAFVCLLLQGVSGM